MMRSRYLILLLLFSACSAQKKAAEKEQRYIQQLQNKYATFSEPSILNIPGGYIRLTDTVPCNDFTNKEVASKGGVMTITKPCPPVTINVDSLIQHNKQYVSMLLELQSTNLELKTLRTENDMLRESNDKLKTQRNTCIKILAGIGVVMIAYIFGRIKKIIR